MSENISRRDFLSLFWGVAGAVALTELSLVGLRFLSPRPVVGEFGGCLTAGGGGEFSGGECHPGGGGKVLRGASAGWGAVSGLSPVYTFGVRRPV